MPTRALFPFIISRAITFSFFTNRKNCSSKMLWISCPWTPINLTPLLLPKVSENCSCLTTKNAVFLYKAAINIDCTKCVQLTTVRGTAVNAGFIHMGGPFCLFFFKPFYFLLLLRSHLLVLFTRGVKSWSVDMCLFFLSDWRVPRTRGVVRFVDFFLAP